MNLLEPVFTKMMSDDSSAIVTCRLGFLDVKESLESFAKQLRIFQRPPRWDIEKIREIAKILNHFKVHYCNVVVKSKKITNMVDSSLELIAGWEDRSQERESYEIGIELIGLWRGGGLLYCQNFLYANIMGRMRLAVCEFVSRNRLMLRLIISLLLF